MKSINTVSEVKLTYHPGVKASERVQVRCSKDIYRFLVGGAFDEGTIEHRESFKVLLLNSSSRILGVYSASEGGIDQTIVDARLVMQAALLSNATRIVLCHNHPSGLLRPSGNDDTLTRRMGSICHIMGIEMVDHLIISPESYYSYADEGRLE
ncbi:DNA repair protein [Bacteroidia bacterium]|nr:DNA repair protein [Bacteroidia bacterium]